MIPINFTDAFNFLVENCPNECQFPTLGRRATHPVSTRKNENGENVIIITGNEYQITKEHWDLVMSRISELPKNEREMTSKYLYPNPPNNEGWDAYNNGQGILNQRSTPYVPAVLRFIITHELFND